MDFVDFRETLIRLSIFRHPIFIHMFPSPKSPKSLESPENVDFWRSDAISFWTFVDFRGFLPFKSPKIIKKSAIKLDLTPLDFWTFEYSDNKDV